MAKFDAGTLRDLRDLREVKIRTEKHPGTAVVIWVVVGPTTKFSCVLYVAARGGGTGTLRPADPPR